MCLPGHYDHLINHTRIYINEVSFRGVRGRGRGEDGKMNVEYKSELKSEKRETN